MKRGYVKLWRKTIDSLVFAHEGMLKLFILCLLKANHEPADVTIPGILSPIHVESGQFITGRNSLYEDYHQLHLRKRTRRKPAPHATTLYRWLLTLQDMSILHIKSHNKYSIITVLNWNQYQQNAQQLHNNCTSSAHKQELTKNKTYTQEHDFAFRKRVSLPQDIYLTERMRVYVKKQGCDDKRHPAELFEDFCNHHRKTGQKWQDWTRAFYTWVRNDKKQFNPNKYIAKENTNGTKNSTGRGKYSQLGTELD